MRGHTSSGDQQWSGDWHVLKSLLPYLLEFPFRVASAMLFLVLAKLASVGLPLVLKHIIDDLDATQSAFIVVPLALLLSYGVLRFVSILFGELRDAIFARVTERAMRRIALKVFQHLHCLELDFHLSRRTGGLSRDIERGTTGISFLLRFMLFNIIPTLVEILLVAGILLLNYDIWFTVITVFAIIIYIIFSVIVTEWRTQYVRETNQMDSLSNSRAIDSLLNFETVKYFGNENYEAQSYDKNLAQWETARIKNRLSLAALNTGQGLIVTLAITAIMILAAQHVASKNMTLGDLVLVNAYMIQLFIPLNFLGFVYREIKNSLANIEQMFALLNTAPRVIDKPGAQTLKPNNGHIVFENVSFAYNTSRKILHNISFEIPPGHKIAIVGPSGSGKSTLARLLFRFYETDAGRILINGQNIAGVTQSSLRMAIGVVPQDTVLFNDTIYYNIAYGNPEADDSAVKHAANMAHLEDFIQNLPEGYETRVGERGLKVSGGEKQRIAIARTLLKNPCIMIFDEATSSLDSSSEKIILKTLNEVATNRTTLAIAHRLSTIIDADNILVLNQGRIIEQGRHAELIKTGGLYAELWHHQQQEKSNKSPVESTPILTLAQDLQ